MKSLKFFVGAIIFVLSICFINCASQHPDFTLDVASEMKTLETLDASGGGKGFRFFVSTDVELRRTNITTSSVKDNTTVRDSIINDVIYLKKSTTGRALPNSYKDGKSIEIYFEQPIKGDYKTMMFVLKPKDSSPKPGDLFYFFYEEDDKSTGIVEKGGKNSKIKMTIISGNIIRYGKDENGNDKFYQVSYKGKNEPYLLYMRDVKETTKKRTLKGVR